VLRHHAGTGGNAGLVIGGRLAGDDADLDQLHAAQFARGARRPGISAGRANREAEGRAADVAAFDLVDLAGKVALFLEASMGRLAEYHVADALIAMLESDLGD
jgi:hypothetical protein